jgi:hypothetical protein
VVSFVAAGAARHPGLRSGQVLGAGQFVAGIIDHVVAGQLGRSIGAHLPDLYRQDDDHEQEEKLHPQRGQHAAVGKKTVRCLAGQTRC